MTPETYKQIVAIERLFENGDLLALRDVAKRLCATVELLMDAKTPDNYVVYSPNYGNCKWYDLVNGTRDYAMGYVEASHEQGLVIAVGSTIIWPDDRKYSSLHEPDEHAQRAIL